MEVRELSTFIQVANLQSFSKAALKLGYSQAAVTIQIKQLEKELGILLFERIGKKTSMTYEGQVFYQYASNIIHDIGEVKERLSEKKALNGRLRIGTIESICSSVFPDLLHEYHTRNPEVTVSIITESPDKLLDMMGQNQVDVVYLMDQRMYDTNWIKVMEKPEEVVFAASSLHPFCKKNHLELDELLKESFILTEKDASYRFILEQYLASLGKSVNPYLSIGNTEFIIRMIQNNLGISFLPKFVIEPYVKAGSLAALDIAGFHMQVWRQIFYHKDKWLTGEMKTFIELSKNLHNT